jgi:hypothetical protein
MVSEAPVSQTEVLPPTPLTDRPQRKPSYKDPVSIVGWGVALAAIVLYWYYFVRTPAPKPGEEVARLTAIEGRVKVKPNAREGWGEGRLADRLHVGDVVQTDPRSGAEVSFDSGSVVRVRSDSIVYIGGSAESSTAAWRVQSGHVHFSVGDQATEIVTPTVRATAMREASGNIDVGDAGDTGVKIFRGQAELQTRQGERITLSDNQAVQVDAAGKAGKTLDLPPPPTLLAPAARAQLPFVAPPEVTARLSWTEVERGVSYRVALDYNVTQANLLLSAALDEQGVQDTSHELKGLNPGRYFWRVAAVNKDGYEGAFSRVSFFAVVQPVQPTVAPTPTAPGPPVLALESVEEVEPGIVHVHGRTDPGSRVTVDGHALSVLPDGSFSEFLRHSEPGNLVVRTTGSDGRFREQTRPVAVRR